MVFYICMSFKSLISKKPQEIFTNQVPKSCLKEIYHFCYRLRMKVERFFYSFAVAKHHEEYFRYIALKRFFLYLFI